jgi:protein SCO1/2
LLVAGCNKAPEFQNLDITGNTQFGSNFSLPDTSGKTRTLGGLQGPVVVLFFGYTHCPDVCPTTHRRALASRAATRPRRRKRVQVLLVTVDPAIVIRRLCSRNTCRRSIRRSSACVRPIDAQLAKITKDLRVYYAKVPGKTPDSYTMDHTAASYVFDHGRQAASVRARRPRRPDVGARHETAARLTRSRKGACRITRPFSNFPALQDSSWHRQIQSGR